MRSTLSVVGALLILGYPLVLLFAIVGKLDQSQKKPETAAIILTSSSANQWLERDSESRRNGVLRNTTVRRSGN